MRPQPQIGFGARAIAAAGDSNLYPDPEFLDTIDGGSNYVSTSAPNITVTGGQIVLADCNTTTHTVNTTSAGTKPAGVGALLIAALANSTAYNVTITVSGYVGGSVRLRLKSGSYVDFGVNGNGTFEAAVTTGTSALFGMHVGAAVAPATCNVDSILIEE